MAILVDVPNIGAYIEIKGVTFEIVGYDIEVTKADALGKADITPKARLQPVNAETGEDLDEPVQTCNIWAFDYKEV
jgi:hypothetical protein